MSYLDQKYASEAINSIFENMFVLIIFLARCLINRLNNN